MPPDPTDDADDPAPRPPPAEGLSPATVHELTGDLAVVKGQAQLAARRLRSTGAPDLDRLLAGLAAVEAAADRACARLDGLRRRAPPDGP